MDIKQKTGLAIGGAAIAAGAVFGVTYALSGLGNEADAQPTTQARNPGERPDPGGVGRPGGMADLASALATKLGADEAEVSEAIRSAMQAGRPDGQPSAGAQPSGGPASRGTGDRTAMDAALAKAIATKLGIDEAKVSTALAEVRAEQQAGRPGGTTSAPAQPSASPTR